MNLSRINFLIGPNYEFKWLDAADDKKGSLLGKHSVVLNDPIKMKCWIDYDGMVFRAAGMWLSSRCAARG